MFGRQSLLNKSYLTFVDKRYWEIGQMQERALNYLDTLWPHPVFQKEIIIKDEERYLLLSQNSVARNGVIQA